MVQRISFFFVICLLLVGGAFTPLPATAQGVSVQDFNGMEEGAIRGILIQLIMQLQEQALILQREQYEDTYQEDTNIIHGSSYVEATKKLTVYDQPGETKSIGTQFRGDGGEVSDGPRLIAGAVWWKVAFTDDHEGWVMEAALERIPSVSITVDEDGDGVPDKSTRLIGDYRADRIILFPHRNGVTPLYIEEGMAMIGSHEEDYISGQVDKTINGPVTVLQSDPYQTATFVKGEDTAIPIAWQAVNVPMNSEVEVQVEALRLVDSPLSGGTWSGEMLVGDSASRYFWNIEGVGRIGAGDYRSHVRVKECLYGACAVIAESPYRYFSIQNPE